MRRAGIRTNVKFETNVRKQRERLRFVGMNVLVQEDVFAMLALACDNVPHVALPAKVNKGFERTSKEARYKIREG